MRINNGNGSNKKFRQVAKSNSSGLIERITPDDNMKATLLDIERVSSDGFICVGNMPTIIKYLINNQADFPSYLENLMGMTKEIEDGIADFNKSISPEDRVELGKIIPMAKLNRLYDAINSTGVLESALVGYIASKYIEGLNNGINDVKKIIINAAESGEVSDDVIRALSEAKFLEIEEEVSATSTGKFKNSKKSATMGNNDSKKLLNRFLNNEDDTEEETSSFMNKKKNPFGGGFGGSGMSFGNKKTFGGFGGGSTGGMSFSNKKSFGGFGGGSTGGMNFTSKKKSFGGFGGGSSNNELSFGNKKPFGGNSSSKPNPFKKNGFGR